MFKRFVKFVLFLIRNLTLYNMKRLIKSTNKVLFGVCGGLGEYFDVDPIWFRVGFLLSFFGFGAGLLAYIIFAIIMPNE